MNNIHVVVADIDGNGVSKGSGGAVRTGESPQQKHRSRRAPSHVTEVARRVAAAAYAKGHRLAHVHLNGPSASRLVALRGLVSGGLNIFDLKDVTPLPTNGCRPKKARRI
jgi:small subunit ribosomal protein S11